MKKTLFLIAIFSLIFCIFLVNFSLAQEREPKSVPAGVEKEEKILIKFDNPLKAKTLQELIEGILDVIFLAALAIAPMLLMVAGLMLMLAAGNPSQIAQARRIIVYTLVGLAIIMFGKGFIAVLEQLLKPEVPVEEVTPTEIAPEQIPPTEPEGPVYQPQPIEEEGAEPEPEVEAPATLEPVGEE